MANEPIETFVGREKDLEELHQIMVERKVAAITGAIGTGGIGKTELARMYAKRYRDKYPAGVFWATLRGQHVARRGTGDLKNALPRSRYCPLF